MDVEEVHDATGCIREVGQSLTVTRTFNHSMFAFNSIHSHRVARRDCNDSLRQWSQQSASRVQPQRHWRRHHQPFEDFARETTNVILPAFITVLGIPAIFLGIIEGGADAVASFTKLVAGHLSDQSGLRQSLVVVGHRLTPLGQVLIALAAGWPTILLGRMASWFGKGLRGPLRDSNIVSRRAAAHLG